LVEQSDLATVHANHYKRIYDICKKNNKEVMMYGDIILSHPEILEKIPKDITIVDWHYFPKFNYPSAKTFDTAGFNYIVSPTVWNFNAAFPENFFAIPNIQTFIEDGINNNSMGMINSSWGDFGAETFREYNLYGYAWSAQCSWNISESDANSFDKTFFKQFFGTDDNKIELIYKNLTDPVNQLVWGNIWRHPLLDYRKADWRQFNFPQASKFYWMKNENSDLEILANFKESATNNKEFLDLLEFTLKLKKWFLVKQETQIELHNILDSSKYDFQKTKLLIEKNISNLTELKNKFSELWKEYNKPDNLWMIEEKFDRLITYFEETKIQLEQLALESPLLKSKWIYYPNDENKFIYKVEFTNKMNINEEIKSAQLQLIADTFAKLFINGNEVDSVFTKRSGSLWIEQQRIKLIDVSKYLKQGENEILVEARNYYDSKTPGINIIAEIITEKDTVNFMSDENWKTMDLSSDNNSIDLNKWVDVEVKQNPLEVIAPNFATKRKSWIER
ncbi:MAG: hypothetical protein KDC52_18090, partial [Ignavibacteriae bacterium]|nr:hypothetical protein [Ignavibacteriota bacterium]